MRLDFRFLSRSGEPLFYWGRYNPLSQEWAKDECVLKMEEAPFAHGAMRECYRQCVGFEKIFSDLDPTFHVIPDPGLFSPILFVKKFLLTGKFNHFQHKLTWL